MALVHQPGFQPRLGEIPLEVQGGLRTYLQQIRMVINSLPRHSWFSGLTPNSTVTGYPGDLATNLASGSTVSRLWLMGGDPAVSAVTNLGWRMISLGGT